MVIDGRITRLLRTLIGLARFEAESVQKTIERYARVFTVVCKRLYMTSHNVCDQTTVKVTLRNVSVFITKVHQKRVVCASFDCE